ncbi:MAG: tetratricopeptide repeat protein [Rhabdochlamydiaceae bacterium]
MKYATALNQLWEQKKYDEGLKLVESVFNKNNPSDWYNKGNLLWNLSRIDEAIECYNEAISLDKHYVKAWYRKGSILFTQQQRYLESTICFEKIIDLEQKNDFKNDKWSGASAFSCMIAYIGECDKYTLAKQPRPYEIEQKRLFWEAKVREFLEDNQIIPKFDNETKFLKYCLDNMKNILDKLEPIAGIEFRYRTLGFFKYTRGSHKVYKDPDDGKWKRT